MHVLSLISYYLPGCRAGGPIRTQANMVARLSDEFEWSIIAGDRDLGDQKPYANTSTETWLRVGGAAVMYLPRQRQTPRLIADHLRRSKPDVLYLNSLFNARLTLPALALRAGSPACRWPTIIAPRGIFSPAALAHGKQKKLLSLLVARGAGLFRDVLWQASCAHEADDIRRALGTGVRLRVAPDLTEPPRPIDVGRRQPKKPGRLKLIHMARITPIKNLQMCLQLISRLDGEVHLDIAGPIEDAVCWRQCHATIAGLRPNTTARYIGVVPHDRVADTLANYDGLLLPTQCENFGHAIVEALAAGCPPIISNCTPWRQLHTQGAGWDLPLNDQGAFRRVLSQLVALGEPEHLALRRGAQALGQRIMDNNENLEQNRQMLLEAASRPRPGACRLAA